MPRNGILRSVLLATILATVLATSALAAPGASQGLRGGDQPAAADPNPDLTAGLPLASRAGSAVGPAGALNVAATAGPRGLVPGLPALHRLLGQVVPGLDRLVPLGAVDPTQRMQVAVAIAHSDPTGEAAAAAAVSDPRSARYRQWFTPDKWAATFGIPVGAERSIEQVLTAHGLRTAYRSRAHDLVLLDGTVAEVEDTFAIHLRSYRAADRQFTANDVSPLVPDGVTAVLGLQNLTVRTRQSTCAGPVCAGTVEASDLWSAYDMPDSNRGRGQTVAIIGAGDYIQPVRDLRQFEAERGLPRVGVRAVNVVDDQADTSAAAEWDMDMQAASGTAPDLRRLDLYFASGLTMLPAAFAAWLSDPSGPAQASASFGECESLGLAVGDVAAEAPMFVQAVAQGRTVFVSSGDNGGSCGVLVGNGFLNTGAPQVEWPASSPYVVAVGGTELYTDGSARPARVLEKAWDYSGGGTSLTQPAPAWQQPIVPAQGRCAVGLDARPTGGPCRALPDVAALSGNLATDQFNYVSNGSDSANGGTSLSAPLWAGMWARVQAASRRGLGFAAPVLYGLAADTARDTRDFTDISVGTNGQYPALPRSAADPTGWDYVTGLGVPDVAALMTDVTGSVRPADPGAPTGTGQFAVEGPPDPRCPSAGVNDPYGDVPFPLSSTDFTTVRPRFEKVTGGRLSVLFKVPDLATASDLAVAFYFQFDYAGHIYRVQASHLSATADVFQLYEQSTALGKVTGDFDFVNGQVTMNIDAAAFNQLARPTQPLGPGRTVTFLVAQSQFGALFTDYVSPVCAVTFD